MGQGGSISENKSIILSNWVQTKPNSNLFYNKVTNQQLQRHEVLINDKQEISSYATRMQDQSGLICRLIYFHPKFIRKEQPAKKHHAKQSSQQDIQDNTRAKSMLSQQYYPKLQQILSPYAILPPTYQQAQPKIYSVYTDRMIPVKQWNKDKIIDVIEGFRKLTQVYGLFKVREYCICQNERKQIKVWINQNPVSNFVIESVQSEEDMIADLAALLVSRKQKIAKELLDLQFFYQVKQHFSKLRDCDLRKYMQPTNSTATKSNRQVSFPTTSTNNRQSETSQPSLNHPPQVNNFYNVFVNSDNNYTVNNSLQNSKYNIINKSSLGNPYYHGKSNQPPPPSKQSEQEQNTKKNIQRPIKTYKNQNDFNVKREYSPTTYELSAPHQIFQQSPGLTTIQKSEQKDPVKNTNQSSQLTSMNQVSRNSLEETENKTQIKYQDQHLGPGSQCNYPSQKHEEKTLMENTSIMMFATKGNSAIAKKTSFNSENDNKTLYKEQKHALNYMTTSQKKVLTSGLAPSSSIYSNQNPKSNLMPKFIVSSHQQIKNRSKNNSRGDIDVRENLKTQHSFINDRIPIGKKQTGLNINKTGNLKTDNCKQFFSNEGVNKSQSSYIQNYLSHQPTCLGKKGIGNFKQKPTQMNRNSGPSTKHQNFGDQETKSFIKTQYTHTVKSQSKVFVKSQNYENNKLAPSFESNRNVVSQMSTLKPPNIMSQLHANPSSLSKKSFPKYFQDKQSAKSIQKYYEKSLEQREKSRAIIGNLNDDASVKNVVRGFGGDGFHYQPSKRKDITQQVVAQVFDSEACSQQVIPQNNQQTLNPNNQKFLKLHAQHYEPRRKFPSTHQGKTKKILDVKKLEQMECKRSKPGTQVDSQQTYINSCQGTKSNFLESPQYGYQKQRQLKKSNNTCFNEGQNKNSAMTHSYFSHLNTNNSLLITHSQYDKMHGKKKIFETDVKKRKQFESIGRESDEAEGRFRFRDLETKKIEEMTQVYTNFNSGSGPFYRNDENESLNNEDPKSRDSIVDFSQSNQRNQSFPYQPQSVLRKNEKQFTFFNSNQKPKGVAHIQQIRPFQAAQVKNHTYTKKQSLKSADQQDTLPRTTADQKQKRMFKATRISQILIETSDLHSSDPGKKIQQIVQKLQNQRQALKINNNAEMMVQQKLQVKQCPKFKKWQPSINVYGSLINQQQMHGSCIKKKEYAKSQKQPANYDKLSQQDSQKDEHQKTIPAMIHSQNLETKKKIRKQVFMDYKGLFGDENPFQKEQTHEEKEKARRIEVKKKREQEQRMLENVSSKDLLIQEKVQKQKEKHAQLKSDLSKLFFQEN